MASLDCEKKKKKEWKNMQKKGQEKIINMQMSDRNSLESNYKTIFSFFCMRPNDDVRMRRNYDVRGM